MVDCPDEDEIILADATRFRQGLFNLLSNACKFTEDGAVTLTVRSASIVGRRWVEWSVSDTGIGIASADIKKLFHSFSQVDSSTTRKFGGTGLGLAITQKLCELMGAEISVHSEPGCGSRFWPRRRQTNQRRKRIAYK